MGFRIDPSTIVKTLSAFLAGLVLVLGGGLIYSRSQEPIHPLEVAPVAPAKEMPPMTVEDQNVPEDAIPANPPPAQHRIPKAHPIPRTHLKSYSIAQIRTPDPVPATRLIAAASGASVNLPPAPNPVPQTASQTDPQPQPLHTSPPVLPPPPQPHVVTLQPGTSLVVRLGETLSSDHNSTGDTFRGTLDLPIIVNEFIISDRGSVILGRVNYAEKARLMGGSADLVLTLTEINTTDGQLVRVETNLWEQKGADMKMRNAPKMLFGAAVGAVAGALSGASQGAGLGDAFASPATSTARQRALVLPIDTRIPFRLARPLTITEKLK